MLFLQDQSRFWKWSALYTEHVASGKNEVVKLAWELRSMEMFRAGWFDNIPQEVRAFLSEKVKETELPESFKRPGRETFCFCGNFMMRAQLKRIKMTITAHAVMALLKLWEDLGRKNRAVKQTEGPRGRNASGRGAGSAISLTSSGKPYTRMALRSVL